MNAKKTGNRFLACTLAFLLCFGGSFSYAFTEGIEGMPEVRQEETASSDGSSGNELDLSDPSLAGSEEDEGDPDGIGNSQNPEMEAIVVYDPQPATIEDVRNAIAVYEAEYQAALEAEGFLAALEVLKPRWEYEVAAELMPVGWNCQLVDWDTDFGAIYYTFFPAPNTTAYGAGFVVEPPIGYGSDISNYFNIINGYIDPQYTNVAVITEDSPNEYGSMWANEKLDLTLPFKTAMYLHLGHEEGNTSPDTADGMTFTMHNDPGGLSAIGGLGEGLGVYKGRKSDGGGATTPDGTYLRNSLVIEFDTYANDSSDGAFVDDPVMNGYSAHCALVIPTQDEITQSDHQNVFYFNTMQDWAKFEVEWEPDGTGGGTLTYSLKTVTNESNDYTTYTYTIANVNAIFGGTEVFWGFTGTTGGYTALQAAAITKLPTQEFVARKTVTDSTGTDINGGQANVGDILSYSITVTAEKAITGIGPLTIVDELSPYTKYVGGNITVTTSDTGNPSFEVTPTFAGNTMTIDTGHILDQVGDWLTVTFDVIVLGNGMGETVENYAVAIAANLTEPQETNTTKVEIVKLSYKTVDGNSEAGIGGAAVAPDDEITYRIGYMNSRGATADLTITDKLPVGLEYISNTGGGTYTAADNTVVWTITGVPDGGTGYVTLTVRVTRDVGAFIINKAEMEWDTGGGPPGKEDPEIIIPVVSYKVVDESSAAGVGGAAVVPGDEITYVIGYVNPTGAVADLTITDKLPVGLEYISHTGGGVYMAVGNKVVWTFSGVPVDGAGYVTLTARVTTDAGAFITNKAEMEWDTGGGPPEKEVPEITNPVVSYKMVDESSEAGVGGAAVAVGDVITYRIGYVNPTGAVADLTITDKLPVGLEYISHTGGGVYTAATNEVVWTITGVPVDGAGYVTLTAKVTADVGAFILNKAEMEWDTGGPPEKEVPEVIVPVTSYKMVDGNSAAGAGEAAVTVGDEITFRIGYVNPTGAVADLTITDKLPVGLEYISHTGGGAYNAADNKVVWTFNSVPVDGTGYVTLTAKVTADAGAFIINKAEMEWDTGGGPPEKEDPEVIVPITSYKTVDGSSEAGVGGAAVAVGDVITYRIGYVNPTGAVADLTITDKLPVGLEYISHTGGGTYTAADNTVVWTITGVPVDGAGYVTLTAKVTADVGDFIFNKAEMEWDTGGPPEKEVPEVIVPVGYTLTVQAGTGGSVDTSVNGVYVAGSVVTITATANSGYSFSGWTSNNGGSFSNTSSSTTTFTMPAANVILTANFRSNGGGGSSTYTVTYNANGGTGSHKVTGIAGGTTHTVLTLSATGISYSGYTFTGWNTKADGSGTDYDPTDKIIVRSNITLYAQWEKKRLDTENHFAYIIGYPDNTVRPENNITRAEVATIFLRLLTQEYRAEIWSKTNDYPDVNRDAWYNNAISTLTTGGVLTGYSDGSFVPNGYITRAEFASIAVRFAGEKSAGNSNAFSDITGHWAEDDIKLAAALGYVSGYGDSTFRPDNYITRAEVATLLNNVLNRHVESKDDLLSGMVIWLDNTQDKWYYLAVQEATNSHYYYVKTGGIYEKWTELREVPNWADLEKPDSTPNMVSY